MKNDKFVFAKHSKYGFSLGNIESMTTWDGLATRADVYFKGKLLGEWHDDGCSIIPQLFPLARLFGEKLLEQHPEVGEFEYNGEKHRLDNPEMALEALFCELADMVDAGDLRHIGEPLEGCDELVEEAHGLWAQYMNI